MTRSQSRWSRSRLLLAAMLAPVVVLGSPHAAVAVQEATAGASWSIAGTIAYGDVECGADFSLSDTGTIYVENGDCIGSWDGSPGQSQPGEAGGAVKLWVTGVNCTGSVSGTLTDHPDNGTVHVAGTIPDLSWYAKTDSRLESPNCDPAQACIMLTSDHWGEESFLRDCVPLDLDPPGVAPELPVTTTCEHFDPLRVRVWKTEGGAHPAWSGYGSATGGYSRLHVKVTGTRKIGAAGLGIAITPTLSGSTTVNTYERNVYPDSTAGSGRALTNGFEMWEGVGAANYFAEPTSVNTTVQIMSLPYDSSSRTDQQTLPAKRRLASWYTSNAATRWQNDPNNCLWTFGKKRLADNPNSTLDDPSGPLTELAGVEGDDTGGPTGDSGQTPGEPVADPGESPEGCESFSFGDPTSWAGAGICQLVKLLGAVWRAIEAVPGQILGGLSALFVPVDAPSFSDVPSPLPAGWLPSMPDLGGAECGSLTFPEISLGFNDWTAGPVNYADTCNAPWPTVRAFTYNGMLVLILVSAVWMGYRAIASGLGMGVQSGGDDE